MRTACISLWQPWSSLLMDGVKVHETRGWPIPRRLLGARIIIHAAKRKPLLKLWSDELVDVLRDLDFTPRGLPLNEFRWPLGVALGSGVVASCQRVETVEPASDADRAAGDWRPGRFAWRFEQLQPFDDPIPLRGRQGIFYEDHLL